MVSSSQTAIVDRIGVLSSSINITNILLIRELKNEQYKFLPGMAPYEKALGFFIKCWMGHGSRTNGYKVGWKNDVQGRKRAYSLLNW